MKRNEIDQSKIDVGFVKTRLVFLFHRLNKLEEQPAQGKDWPWGQGEV